MPTLTWFAGAKHFWLHLFPSENVQFSSVICCYCDSLGLCCPSRVKTLRLVIHAVTTQGTEFWEVQLVKQTAYDSANTSHYRTKKKEKKKKESRFLFPKGKFPETMSFWFFCEEMFLVINTDSVKCLCLIFIFSYVGMFSMYDVCFLTVVGELSCIIFWTRVRPKKTLKASTTGSTGTLALL